MDHLVGTRVELTEAVAHHPAGSRGVIGKLGGYIGVVIDGDQGLWIVHNFGPITNVLHEVIDEREPEPKQLSLFDR